MIEYYFKLGAVEASNKPDSPTIENVKNWYEEWVKHTSAVYYEAYLVGSFAEKIYGNYDGKPYDVDVVLIGDITDGLKSLLEYGIELGFKHNIMIDIWHNDKLIDLNKREPFIQTRSYKTFIGSVTYRGNTNHTNIELWNGDGVELESGLFQYKYTNDSISRSWDKANDRLLNNRYKAIQKNLKDI